MPTPYIVDMVRTPVGRFGKSLKDEHPAELAAYAARKLVERTGVDPSIIDFVVMGHVIRAGTSMDTARQVVLRAGFPLNIDGMTVDMVCASGMAAIITAYRMIKLGEADVVLAGGTESMSYAPIMLPSSARWGIRHLIGRKAELVDAMVHDGLFDVFEGRVMGEEADLVAKKHGATRDELDWIAYESYRRAGEAWDKGYMKDYVVPYEKNGKVLLDYDEGVRRDTSIEKLSRIPPAFFPDGLHTAGNSSQLSDGAAVLLLMSEDKMKELGYKPKARILGYSFAGVETWRFPEAPIYAVRDLLKKTGLSVGDIDYWENNEAFAVSSWLMHHIAGIPYEKLNVHGGAIAIGHPLGMSGARITIELINVLEKHGGRRGVASICHGLGGAAALALELT